MDQASRNNPETGPKPRNGEPVDGMPEDLFGIITDVEAQLTALKKAHELHRREMAILDHRKRELDERSRVLDTIEQEITDRSDRTEAELAQQRASLEARVRELDEQASDLDKRETSFLEAEEASRAELDELRESLARERSSIESQREELAESRRALEQDRERLETERDRAEAELEEARQAIGQERAAIEAERDALGQATEALERDRQELNSGRENLAAQEAELDDRRRAIEARDEELGEREAQLLERVSELEEEERRFRERCDERQASLEERERRIAEQEEESSKREQGLGRRESALEAEAEALETRRADFEEEMRLGRESLDTRKAELDRLADELGQRESELEERADEIGDAETLRLELEQSVAERDRMQEHADAMRSEVSALRYKITEAEAEADQARADHAKAAEAAANLGKQRRAIEEERNALAERASELETKVAELSEQAARLEVDLERTARERASLSSNADDQVTQLVAEVDRLTGELTTLDQKLEEKTEAAEQNRVAKIKAEHERDDLAQRLEIAEGQLEEAHQRITDLEAGLDRARADIGAHPSAASSNEWVRNRRERLQLCKKLINRQSSKIRKASELLTQRFAQCEEVLSMRAEVLAARRETEELREKIESKRAANKAGWLVAAGAVALLALSALSWLIAGEVAPATYAATAVIVAEADGRRITPEERAEWQQYHTELLGNPRFLERASDRLTQRGLAERTEAGSLAGRLARDLTQLSVEDGRLTLELRGPGKARTERELDTIARTLISESNAARQRRAVGVTASMAEAPSAGEPIDTSRPMYAAIGVCLAALLTLMFGSTVWRRMAKASRDHELRTKLDILLDEAQWVDPREQSHERRRDAA